MRNVLHREGQEISWKLTVFLLLLTLPVALAGCSYFNAFYNTKRAFHEAENARERSTDLSTKPQQYNDAVEAGARVIEMYPGSKYIDDTLFIMGQSYYWLEDYHKARRKFEELLANYPASPQVMEARMWLGKVNVQLKKRQEATSELRGLIADTDDPQLISESRFALAELYYLDSLFVKAAEEFAKIPEISEDDELTGESYYRAGESLFREKRYDEAAGSLKDALDHKQTPIKKFQTRLLCGQSLRESGKPEAALDIYNSLLKDKRYFKEHGKVRVQKGLALSDLGHESEAFNEWQKTITDYARSDEAAQAYYEMGLVHLRQPGERPEAKEMFDKSRVEKARSKYSMKSDTMLTMLNRVDRLNLDRVRMRQRIALTEKWIINPISPSDTTAFRAADYYDSLAIDSLKLVQLWYHAWRDSVILPPPDTTQVVPVDTLRGESQPDSATQADSLLSELADASMVLEAEPSTVAGDSSSAAGQDSSLVMKVPVSLEDGMLEEEFPDTDETQLVTSPQLDPFGEYAPRHGQRLTRPPGGRGPGAAGYPGGQGDSATFMEQQLLDYPSDEMMMRRFEMELPPDSLRPEGMSLEEWHELISERFSREEISGYGIPQRGRRPGPQGETGPQIAPWNDIATGEAAETQPSEPVSGPNVETIKVYDIQPVIDSLAVMRVNLQEHRFQLGEIQLFDLQQPDSARFVFRELSEPSNVDSVRARALSVLAYIERDQGDSTAADSILHRIVDEFPATRAGRQVIETLGLENDEPVTAAELAYREAEQLYFESDQYQDAYNQYRWVGETYPGTIWAPRAMYAAAYIAGEQLDDGETAEDLLTGLINDYPESAQAQRAREKISGYDTIRYASEADTMDIASEFADIDALGEDEVDQTAEIVGGLEALSSTLDARNLLPQEVIQGTGGEVLLRFIVGTDKRASNFKIVIEDPPGSGLGRALVAGLEEVAFAPAKKDGEPVATKIERRYTLPLDAPPNIRPLPKR